MKKQKKRVLIVDDEADIIRLIESALKKTHQYEIISAKDGFFAGIQVGIFNPDLVILDIKMPGIDGFEVCHKVKSNPRTKHIKIICVTGYAEDGNIERMVDLGADAYLIKPFSLEELNLKVRELLK